MSFEMIGYMKRSDRMEEDSLHGVLWRLPSAVCLMGRIAREFLIRETYTLIDDLIRANGQWRFESQRSAIAHIIVLVNAVAPSLIASDTAIGSVWQSRNDLVLGSPFVQTGWLPTGLTITALGPTDQGGTVEVRARARQL